MKSIFYISKKKLNKKGLAPIYCRITVKGRRSELATGFFAPLNQWQNQSLIETSKENILINSALIKQKNTINTLYYELLLKDKPVSADILKNLFTGKTKVNYSFIELIDEFLLHKFQSITAYNTIKTYKARKALITDYLKEKNAQE